MTQVDIADLDCIFLTYYEPKREEFWAQISNMVPWAKRVDGVKGSDAAHKAAADASDTERFVLIDGDNLPEERFFNLVLDIPENMADCVFRWKGRNDINGLMYGNGGLSCWTREFVNNMRTHENTDGTDATLVEFCFDNKYLPMNNCYSTSYPNGDEYHAWRAGFREGVKLCLDRGAKPPVDNFPWNLHHVYRDHLSIWHNIGRDADYGEHAIQGARYGTYKLMCTDWDWTETQDFDKLKHIYDEWQQDNWDQSILAARLGLDIHEYTAEQSAFFKHHMQRTYHEHDAMTTEIELIRKAEGW